MEREVVEIDHKNLRDMLQNLIGDLSVPYLEKRARTSSHKSNALEELSDVIQEVSQRERELQAAAGIASMLLDNNEILHEKTETLKGKLKNNKEKSKILKERMKELKFEAFEQEKSKVEEAQDAVIQLTNENENLLRRLNTLKDWPELHNDALDKYKSKITDMKALYTQQVSDLKSKAKSLEQTIAHERSLTEEVRDELGAMIARKKDLEGEKKNLCKRVEHLEEKLQRFSTENLGLEEKIDKLNEMNEYYKDRTGKLKIKLQALKLIIHKNESLGRFNDLEENTTHEGCSLKSELQEIEEFTLKEALVCHEKAVSVLPSYRRKSPSEEFFQLTAQAILMNLPYMEAVCSVSIRDLYEKATAGDIPFHQWHTWIENQMNSAYIQKIYRDLSVIKV